MICSGIWNELTLFISQQIALKLPLFYLGMRTILGLNQETVNNMTDLTSTVTLVRRQRT